MKYIKTIALTIVATILVMFFPKQAYAACTVPSNVGTLSVGSDKVAVGWTVPDGTSDIASFGVSYTEDGGSFPSSGDTRNINFDPGSDPGVSVETSNGDRNYTLIFDGLTRDTTYYWRLKVHCTDSTSNNYILSGFVTTPALNIEGFLFVNGTINLARRVEVTSNFSYLTNPIFDVLTESIGSGRVHVISVD